MPTQKMDRSAAGHGTKAEAAQSYKSAPGQDMKESISDDAS
jgi:hypothetical protein